MISEKSLSLPGRLSCLTVKCPDCQQTWLAPGLASGDTHACKECGAVFTKREAGVAQPPRDLPCPSPTQGVG